KLGVKDLQDAALFRVRPLFATLPGVSAPPPFGGSPRAVVIQADPDRLRAVNISPEEVVGGGGKGYAGSPAGNLPFCDMLKIVPVSSVVTSLARLGVIAIRPDGPRPVFIHPLGTLED